MSHGTTQERANLTLELRDQKRAAEYQRAQTIQRQADEQRQKEKAQRLKLIQEQEHTIRREQNRGQRLSTDQGRGM